MRRNVVGQFADYRRRLRVEVTELPEDARVVSYLVAAAMVLDLPERQDLLEQPTTALRLRAEADLLRRERALVGAFDALPAVDLGVGKHAVSLGLGGDTSCALLDDNTLKCWGLNEVGQLGLGDTANRGDGAGEMGAALPALDLGTGRTAVELRPGSSHMCVRLDNGDLKCWGEGSQGQLGTGATANLGDGANEMGDALLPVALE